MMCISSSAVVLQPADLGKAYGLAGKIMLRRARPRAGASRSGSTAGPHVVGIDDGPFEKDQPDPAPVVAVMMEGAAIVEAIAVGAFPVDGDAATAFLGSWITEFRFYRAMQAVILGGITIAGLGVIDVAELAQAIARPVLVVTRRRPSDSELARALRSAGLHDRLPLLKRSPPATRVGEGLYLAPAGIDPARAVRLLTATIGKSRLPEPLRVAHLVARALVMGESRGRV